VQDPAAFGMVLATLVDRSGKPVGDAAKGQLYVTPHEVLVIRVTRAMQMFFSAANLLLVGSVAAVIANLFVWKSTNVLWAAVVAQGLYWLTMSQRRKAMDPVPLSAEQLAAVRRSPRVAIHVPVSDIARAVPPEPQRAGFRKPARFELAEGALEICLSQEQFQSVAAALGRG
jgi:hypothetical protein